MSALSNLLALLLVCSLLLLLSLLLSLTNSNCVFDPWDVLHTILEQLGQGLVLSRTDLLLLFGLLLNHDRHPSALSALAGCSAAAPDGNLEQGLGLIEGLQKVTYGGGQPLSRSTSPSRERMLAMLTACLTLTSEKLFMMISETGPRLPIPCQTLTISTSKFFISDQAFVQRGPGVDVNVTEVGLQPDLLANAREPLVDKERMAEDRCEELGREVVDGELGRKSEAIELDGCYRVFLVVEVAVGGHVDGISFDVMVQELLTSGG
ncbi:hypothetical protein KCU71_g75, partial [Aureobasidium melanogenum]